VRGCLQSLPTVRRYEHSVLASALRASTCLQNTCSLSVTVAHLGLRPRRVGQDRFASDPVVVRFGGQLRPCRPQAAGLTLKCQRQANGSGGGWSAAALTGLAFGAAGVWSTPWSAAERPSASLACHP
jgi:hypothetical protein